MAMRGKVGLGLDFFGLFDRLSGGRGSRGIRRKYLPSLSTGQSHRFKELPVLLSDTDPSRIFENGALNSV
jgi:hypothetical protein